MSVIVEISVPAEDFTLGRSLEGIGSSRYELERMIPTTDAVVPFLWVHDSDVEALEATLEADEDVISVSVLDQLDGRALFRIEWALDINGLVRSIIDRDAAILEAVGTNVGSFSCAFPTARPFRSFAPTVARRVSPSTSDASTIRTTRTLTSLG